MVLPRFVEQRLQIGIKGKIEIAVRFISSRLSSRISSRVVLLSSLSFVVTYLIHHRYGDGQSLTYTTAGWPIFPRAATTSTHQLIDWCWDNDRSANHDEKEQTEIRWSDRHRANSPCQSMFNCDASNALCQYYYPSNFFDEKCGLGRDYAYQIRDAKAMMKNKTLWPNMPSMGYFTLTVANLCFNETLAPLVLGPDMDESTLDDIGEHVHDDDRCITERVSMIHVHKSGGSNIQKGFQHLSKEYDGAKLVRHLWYRPPRSLIHDLNATQLERLSSVSIGTTIEVHWTDDKKYNGTVIGGGNAVEKGLPVTVLFDDGYTETMLLATEKFRLIGTSENEKIELPPTNAIVEGDDAAKNAKKERRTNQARKFQLFGASENEKVGLSRGGHRPIPLDSSDPCVRMTSKKECKRDRECKYNREMGYCYGRELSKNEKSEHIVAIEDVDAEDKSKERKRINQAMESLKRATTYPSDQFGPRDHVLFAVVRDPTERFISSIGQAMGAKGSQRNVIWETLQKECIKSTPAATLKCMAKYVRDHGHWIELHFAPQVIDISISVMFQDVPVAIFPFKVLQKVIDYLGTSDIKSTYRARPHPVLTNMTVRDYDEESLRIVCEIYEMDVIMQRAMGMEVPRCDPFISK